MQLRLRGTFTSLALGGLLAVALVVPTFAAQAASPLAPEVTSAAGSRPCADVRAAAKDNTVGSLRKLGDCEIDRRLDTITGLQSKVANARGLTDADRTALGSQLTAASTGLTSLRTQIDGESDVTALRADLKEIVTDFRIYLLVVPKTAEVGAADAELAAVARLGTLSTKLQGRIDAAKAAGKDVTQAQSDLDAMQAKVGQVSPLVSGIPAALLPLTPAQYNDGSAKPILVSARTSLLGGRGLLNGARADALACIAALRQLR